MQREYVVHFRKLIGGAVLLIKTPAGKSRVKIGKLKSDSKPVPTKEFGAILGLFCSKQNRWGSRFYLNMAVLITCGGTARAHLASVGRKTIAKFSWRLLEVAEVSHS